LECIFFNALNFKVSFALFLLLKKVESIFFLQACAS
jgi:hypothetical protein